ncbi:hypothetical protein TeGR_g9943 [Tetraparma gracilis]|uniref:Uncharacterized protein n=1 Tax=Tetraparma gracilis TaxID=2962635 RepID=A0ABQ6M882_9STRA|nr:hypothetical protein TeGR_g9943 [Tetraparma gracilis]
MSTQTLRYKVMVKDVKKNPFPDDHYCIVGDEFRDDHDLFDSTGHVLVRHRGRPVASTRIVNGNFEKLEAETFGWADVRSLVAPHARNADNLAEPSRVVADRSVRGSNVVPLMYLHCLEWMMQNNIENFVGMANSEARPLMEHYSKWAQAKWITEKPFDVSDFIKGRKLDMCLISVGEAGTPERNRFTLTNFAPAFMAYSMMKSPK